MIHAAIIDICDSLSHETITGWKEYTQGSSAHIRYGTSSHRSYILKTPISHHSTHGQQESYILYTRHHERYNKYSDSNCVPLSYPPFLYEGKAYHLIAYIDGISLPFYRYTTNQLVALATMLGTLHNTMCMEDAVYTYHQGRYHLLYGKDSLVELYTKLLTTNTNLSMGKKIIETLTHRYLHHNHTTYTRHVVSLHGDLHYRNVFTHNEDITFIDPSIYPYGDPIIDIGSVIVSMEMNLYYDDTYDFEYHKNTFLDTYMSITHNTTIMDLYPVVALSLLGNIIDPLVQQQLYPYGKQKFQAIVSLIDKYIKKVLHL